MFIVLFIQLLCFTSLFVGIVMYFGSKTEKFENLSKKIMINSLIGILIGIGTCFVVPGLFT